MDRGRRVELIVEARNQLGESPLWSRADRSLYWLDLKGCSLHRWSVDGGHVVTALGGRAPLGAVAPSRTPGSLVLTRSAGLFDLDPGTGAQTFLVNPIADLPHLHFNDAKTDRLGRLWLGTADETEVDTRALLYRVDPDGVHVADAGFAICNGPAFSPDGGRLYFSDSVRSRILVYEVDDRGALRARRELVRLGPEDGLPDGLTVDATGNLWVAHWAGGRISCYSAEGVLLESLAVPAPNVTSVAFGGPDLDLLFVTSARQDMDDAALRQWPLAGSLFVTRPGVTGIHEIPWAGAVIR